MYLYICFVSYYNILFVCIYFVVICKCSICFYQYIYMTPFLLVIKSDDAFFLFWSPFREIACYSPVIHLMLFTCDRYSCVYSSTLKSPYREIACYSPVIHLMLFTCDTDVHSPVNTLPTIKKYISYWLAKYKLWVGAGKEIIQ